MWLLAAFQTIKIEKNAASRVATGTYIKLVLRTIAWHPFLLSRHFSWQGWVELWFVIHS